MTLDHRLPKAPAACWRSRFSGARRATERSATTAPGGDRHRRAGGNDGPTKVDPGKVTAPTTPFDAKTAFYATSKVKNLLTGMPVTDDDVVEGDDEGRRRAAGAGRRPG